MNVVVGLALITAIYLVCSVAMPWLVIDPVSCPAIILVFVTGIAMLATLALLAAALATLALLAMPAVLTARLHHLHPGYTVYILPT